MYESARLRWVRRIGLTLVFAFVTWPLYVMVIGALTPSRDAAGAFRWWPGHVTFAAFGDVWRTIPLARYLANSAVVAAVSTAVAVAVAVPAAYALARHRFAGRGAVAGTMLATQFVPGLVFLVPLFLSYSEIQRWAGVQLVGSYAGLILTDLTFAVPFSVWLLTGYLQAQPTDVEDAARVDGAGTIALLVRIVVPIAAPGLAAVALFAFGLSWGEVLFASVLTDDRTATVPIGLPTLVSQSAVYSNQLLAAALMTSAPVVAAFMGARRYLISAFATANY